MLVDVQPAGDEANVYLDDVERLGRNRGLDGLDILDTLWGLKKKVCAVVDATWHIVLQLRSKPG